MNRVTSIFRRKRLNAAPGQAKRPQARPRYNRHTGQNLVELAITLPFILVMIFFILEIGRAWMTYEAAKTAAREGAYVASIYHNEQAGLNQMNYKLNAAGLAVTSATVAQVPTQHAYEANVSVTFTPYLGTVKFPTLSGPVTLLPSQFTLSYKSITDVSVY